MSRVPSLRIFISAVSGELAAYREEVARVLRCKELEVREQEHFHLGPATLLEKLRDYIRDCDAVILLIGDQCGGFPSDEHAAALGSISDFRDFRKGTGTAAASYTQWEFILARHFGKPIYTFFTADGFVPSKPNDDSPDLREHQRKYRDWIEQSGKHRGSITTVAKLIEHVLVLPLGDLPSRPIGAPKPISLPYPSLGTLFKGRDEFLTELRASLLSRHEAKRATAIVGKAVHGLGGVGKTRLAVEYAWQHAADYSALLFVIADSPANLRRNLAAFAGPLILNLPEESAQEEDVKVAAALRWLRDHPGWFLILDNIDTEDAAIAAEELLSRLTGGHILITSRLARWSGAVEPLDLDVLSSEASVQFLLDRTDNRRRKRDTETSDATEIARELDGLALALEQAGAYIAHRRISLTEYLTAWRSHSPAVQDWHDPRTTKYPRSVAVTWQTTLDQLGPAELALLRVFAWLAPDPIPLFVLEGEKARVIWRNAISLVTDTASTATDAGDNAAAALANLADFNLIRWDPDAETASVHRVLQEVLRNQIPEQQRPAWLMCSLCWIDVAAPAEPIDVRTWPRWNPLRPHVAAIVAHSDNAGIAERISRLMNDLGVLLMAKANYGEAEPLLRRALAIDERSLGPDHPEVATKLGNLAQLLSETNRLAEAEPMTRRALVIAEQSFGPNHTNVWIRLNNLASLLQSTNRRAEAESLMERALAIAQQSFGPEHPKVATSLNNLASLLYETNRIAEAEPLLRRALAIDELSYGPNHPHVALGLNNLAQLLQKTNRLTEAEPLMRRALAIDEQSYGPDHPNVARDLNNLALLLHTTNRLANAESLMRRALAIDEQSYGPEHPIVAGHLNNLASMLYSTNRFTEAVPLARRALEIDETSYGPDHPSVAGHLNDLASLLFVTNRPSEAEPLMRRALEIDEKSYGPDHTNVARDLNNLAHLLRETNRLTEAEPLIRRELSIYRNFGHNTGHEHLQLPDALEKYKILLKSLNLDDDEIARRLREVTE